MCRNQSLTNTTIFSVRAIKGDRHFWKAEEHDSFELSSTEVRFETTVTGGSKV